MTRTLLAASLALNLLFGGAGAVWLWRQGGVSYLAERLGLARRTHRPDELDKRLRRRFRMLPDTPKEVVFAGDSITAWTPWAEYFSNIRNRGIPGDTADGLLQRLEEIVRSDPSQVFVNIGTNDLSSGVSVDQVYKDIVEIVRRINRDAPDCEVFVVSVLPRNRGLSPEPHEEETQTRIRTLNARLAEPRSDLRYRFVDLTAHFADAQGELRAELTEDGLHLNDEGVAVHCEALRPFVRAEGGD